MRRLMNFTFGIFSLIFVSILAFSYVTEAISNKPINIETVDNRPLIEVTQPQTLTFSGEIDNSGYDISHPQCKSQLPSKPVGFAIIGLNKGKPFTQNPCFEKQWAWALQKDGAAIYINTADPGVDNPVEYGRKIAEDTIERLKIFGVSTTIPIWLDVETYNTWTESSRSVEVLDSTMDVLAQAGYHVGIYSTTAHWLEVTMNAKLGVPTWRALGKFNDVTQGVAAAKTACTQVGIADTIPAMVQFVATVDGVTLDRNILCGDPNGNLGSTNSLR